MEAYKQLVQVLPGHRLILPALSCEGMDVGVAQAVLT